MSELLKCPLCKSDAVIIGEDDFHMSFCKYDAEDGTVEHYFHHSGAIQCTGCNLTLPFFNSDNPQDRQDQVDLWNDIELKERT